MSLAKVGIRGAYFTGAALGVRQVISLATTFYVARQLLPSDLGVFAMVMVVIALAQTLGEIGIGMGLVRSQTNSSTVLSTCFWLSSGIGVMLACMVLLLAPVAGQFYDKPELVPYLQVSTAGLLATFLIPVPMALMQQRLEYKSIAIAQVSGSFLGAISTIALVYSGAGVWALVFQPIVGNFVHFILLGLFARWRPTFEFQLSSVSDILKTGVNLLGNGLVGYFRNNFDVLVIGRSLESKDLGIYGMAQTILYAPMHLITGSVSRVLFPLLAKVQNDRRALVDAVLTAAHRTALMTFPLYFGLFVLADQFVFIVFGDKWLSMIPLIRIMMLSYVTVSVCGATWPLMVALNKTKAMFIMSVISAVIYFSVLLLLIPHGLTAIALGYGLSNALLAMISLGVSLHYAQIPVKKYCNALTKPFLFSMAMVLFIWGLKHSVATDGIFNFAFLILAGAATYGLLIFLFEKAAWQQALNALSK